MAEGKWNSTGFSAGSAKKILMTTSNSPHPVSLISYGGFITTRDGEIVTTGVVKVRGHLEWGWGSSHGV